MPYLFAHFREKLTPDGRWCLMLDFFGCEKEKMGYVPFLSDSMDNADFDEQGNAVLSDTINIVSKQ